MLAYTLDPGPVSAQWSFRGARPVPWKAAAGVWATQTRPTGGSPLGLESALRNDVTVVLKFQTLKDTVFIFIKKT